MALLDGSVKTLCPISTLMGKDDLLHLISLTEFDAVVSDLPTTDLESFRDRNINIETMDELIFSDEDQQISFSQETIWFVPTSGTTSNPKLVKHTLPSLAASALKAKNGHDDMQVWGLFYDATRYAGYQTVFNSLLNGHSLVTPSLSQTINERVQTCI